MAAGEGDDGQNKRGFKTQVCVLLPFYYYNEYLMG